MSRYWAIALLVISFFSYANEEKKVAHPKVNYFTLKPEIITNYITKGSKLGFVNIKIDLVLNDKALLTIVEYHQPLIRDTIISVISRKNEQSIKSLEGREALRKECLSEVNEVLMAEIEMEENIISNLLFTQYLYQ